MPITDSRVSKGTLKFTLTGGGGPGTPLDISCQVTSIACTPKVNAGNSQQVLCGDTSNTGGTTDWTLDATVIQDWDKVAPDQSFVLWCLTNDGKAATVAWTPNDGAKTPAFAGTVTVQPIAIGGAVGVQITSALTWPMTGAPVPTVPTK